MAKPTKIIKKDGRIQSFKPEKVEESVVAAHRRTGVFLTEVDIERLKHECRKILNSMKQCETVTSKEVAKAVESICSGEAGLKYNTLEEYNNSLVETVRDCAVMESSRRIIAERGAK